MTFARGSRGLGVKLDPLHEFTFAVHGTGKKMEPGHTRELWVVGNRRLKFHAMKFHEIS